MTFKLLRNAACLSGFGLAFALAFAHQADKAILVVLAVIVTAHFTNEIYALLSERTWDRRQAGRECGTEGYRPHE